MAASFISTMKLECLTAAKPFEVAAASCDLSRFNSSRSDAFSLLRVSRASSFRCRDLAADRRLRCIRCSLRRRFARSCSVSLGFTSSSPDPAGVSASRSVARDRLQCEPSSPYASRLMLMSVGDGESLEKQSSEEGLEDMMVPIRCTCVFLCWWDWRLLVRLPRLLQF